MIQFSLHCPFCFSALSLDDYANFLRKNKDTRLAACVWCGKFFMNYDIDYPSYQARITRRIDEQNVKKPTD